LASICFSAVTGFEPANLKVKEVIPQLLPFGVPKILDMSDTSE